MTIQTVGLVTFAITVGLNVAGLTLDAVLYTQHVLTVTEFARRNQWLASLIILMNIIGLMGLALHFSAFNGLKE